MKERDKIVGKWSRDMPSEKDCKKHAMSAVLGNTKKLSTLQYSLYCREFDTISNLPQGTTEEFFFIATTAALETQHDRNNNAENDLLKTTEKIGGEIGEITEIKSSAAVKTDSLEALASSVFVQQEQKNSEESNSGQKCEKTNEKVHNNIFSHVLAKQEKWRTGYISLAPSAGRKLQRVCASANQLDVCITRVIAFSTSHAWAFRRFNCSRTANRAEPDRDKADAALAGDSDSVEEWYELDSADFLQAPRSVDLFGDTARRGFVYVLENLPDK